MDMKISIVAIEALIIGFFKPLWTVHDRSDCESIDSIDK